jgi:Ni/Co efflux regulator RcnB
MTNALAAYREVAAETQGEVVATARVARPMATPTAATAEVLGSQYDTTVHLNVVVDPDVWRRPRRDRRRGHRRDHSQPVDDARRRLVG